MSDELKGLLERSRAPGKMVERRRFSLSRDKAIEKMREFSLRDPSTYILELVQAAVFAEARWIAIDVSPERLFFAWIGGRHPTPQQLDNVFDYLFLDRADAGTRHVVQLAIGLNALLQRKPHSIAVEAGNGTVEGTARLELGAGGAGHIGRPETAIHGTWLSVEFTKGWLSRFVGNEDLTEVKLIEAACTHCPVPILINYRAPFGYRAQREVKLKGMSGALSFDEGGRRGALAIPPSVAHAKEGIQIVVGGVRICSRVLPSLGLARINGSMVPLVGVICDDRIRKTADQGDIVEDGRFAELLHAVQPHATALIRSAPGHAGHQPPPLPPIPAASSNSRAEPAEAAVLPEALSEPLEQVGARPPIRLADLKARASRTPVFWVQPETVPALEQAGDPLSFPFCLFVLRPGQALRLGQELGQGAVAWIQTAAEAEFLSRSLDQRSRVHEIRLSVSPGEGLGRRATLILRHHLEGPLPDWAGDPAGSMPMLVRSQGRTTWCDALHLDLPGCSAVLELREGRFDPERGPASLLTLVRRHAWRLLLGRLPPPEADRQAVVTLATALLAVGLCQHFLDPAPASLALSLPAEWGPLAAELRRLPLAPTPEQDLSLDELLLRMHEPEPQRAVVELIDPQALRRLGPISKRLGLEHFCVAGEPDRVLLSLVLPSGGTFRRWVRGRADGGGPGPHAEAILALADSLRARIAPPGWSIAQRLGPCLALLLPEGQPPPPEGLLQSGLRLLLDELVRMVAGDRWSELFTDPADQERARQIGRLALISLSVRLRPASVRCLPSSDTLTWWTLDDLADPERRLTLAPRHGVRVVEPETVLLSWAELRALQAAGIPTPLRFDDPPEVWTRTPDPETLEPQGWLLREPLRVPGLEGWVGLRRPYDPTTAVWVQDSGELLALSSHDGQLPCHGMAWSLSSDDTVSPSQRAMIELARVALYQSLAEGLVHEPDPLWRAEAERYAIDLAVMAWRRAGTLPPTATSLRLLNGLRLQAEDGADLGSLKDWLDLPPSQRPTPRGHAALYQRVQHDPDPSARPGLLPAQGLNELSRRLSQALAASLPGRPPRVFLTQVEGRARLAARWVPSESEDETLSLEVDPRNPLVAEALAQGGEAASLLLLELGRLSQIALSKAGTPIPLFALQDRLLGPPPA